jgi:hypothetical protein
VEKVEVSNNFGFLAKITISKIMNATKPSNNLFLSLDYALQISKKTKPSYAIARKITFFVWL